MQSVFRWFVGDRFVSLGWPTAAVHILNASYLSWLIQSSTLGPAGDVSKVHETVVTWESFTMIARCATGLSAQQNDQQGFET